MSIDWSEPRYAARYATPLTQPIDWQARATAAEAENARLREALATVRDYVADASTGALIYVDSGEGYIAMAKEDLARVDAALESRNVG